MRVDTCPMVGDGCRGAGGREESAEKEGGGGR